MTTWFPLDPARADYGATAGAWAQGADGEGIALLELSRGTVVVVGHMSCGSRESAERHASQCVRADRDRCVPLTLLNSWRT